MSQGRPDQPKSLRSSRLSPGGQSVRTIGRTSAQHPAGSNIPATGGCEDDSEDNRNTSLSAGKGHRNKCTVSDLFAICIPSVILRFFNFGTSFLLCQALAVFGGQPRLLLPIEVSKKTLKELQAAGWSRTAPAIRERHRRVTQPKGGYIIRPPSPLPFRTGATPLDSLPG
jgi:hypothetical protein